MTTQSALPPLSTFSDSGVPPNVSTGYTTLVCLHGFMWHGASFAKMLPLAGQHNARVIAVNQLDYPGSATHSPEELAVLQRAVAATPDDGEAAAEMLAYWRARARDVFDYLVALVREKGIPPMQGDKGGIVLVGWSFGTLWMSAFLAFLSEFDDPKGVELNKYLRRVVLYDGGWFFLGTAPPTPSPYSPASDPALTERSALVPVFDRWLCSYYPHTYPPTAEALVQSTAAPLADPAPAEGDRASARHAPPEDFHPQDWLLIGASLKQGTPRTLKARAMFSAPADSKWSALRVECVFCAQSYWEPVWGAHQLERELTEARRAGKPAREVTFLRVDRVNHFAHWVVPEKILKVFLGTR
ncbi:Alpha/Beta hydrolase protein [Epithele typhae]|uniref:Alpha/Beta hydrolase protein n=1 Tax=Epithele typhae TaxID=378194 RepID=UPI002008D18E|nr:Alpha/Beta hydrolase protein [Epithele typhae]KAH9925863.1 Alpha/Beta hydrolase protein [Epithele typhae]